MRAFFRKLIASLAVLFVVASPGFAIAADISVYGQVQDHSGNPIFLIKVSVYRENTLVANDYTGEDGKYLLTMPAGEPIAVRFDTHPTVNNSRDWHPSVVTGLRADKDIVLDRMLVGVGNTGGEAADIDALAAYQFAAFWTSRGLDSGSEEYGKEAAARLGQMKFTIDVLLAVQRTLIEHFEGSN